MAVNCLATSTIANSTKQAHRQCHLPRLDLELESSERRTSVMASTKTVTLLLQRTYATFDFNK